MSREVFVIEHKYPGQEDWAVTVAVCIKKAAEGKLDELAEGYAHDTAIERRIVRYIPETEPSNEQ